MNPTHAPSGPSVLTQKRDAVRTGLARVALELFAARGFDEVTVEEIATSAGISARTFFRYFATKEEIVLDFIDRLQERLLAAFDARPAGEGAVPALRNAYAVTSAVSEQDRPSVLQTGRILTSSPALRQAMFGRHLAGAAPLVTRLATRMGTGVDDARPRIVAAAMGAVASAEWNAWVEEDGRGDPSQRIVDALERLERGLAEPGPTPGSQSRP